MLPFIREGVALITRGAPRAWLLVRMHCMLVRMHGMLVRAHSILLCTHCMLFRAHCIRTRCLLHAYRRWRCTQATTVKVECEGFATVDLDLTDDAEVHTRVTLTSSLTSSATSSLLGMGGNVMVDRVRAS